MVPYNGKSYNHQFENLSAEVSIHVDFMNIIDELEKWILSEWILNQILRGRRGFRQEGICT